MFWLLLASFFHHSLSRLWEKTGSFQRDVLFASNAEVQRRENPANLLLIVVLSSAVPTTGRVHGLRTQEWHESIVRRITRNGNSIRVRKQFEGELASKRSEHIRDFSIDFVNRSVVALGKDCILPDRCFF